MSGRFADEILKDESLTPAGHGLASVKEVLPRMASHILVIQNGKYKGRKVRLTEPETVVGRGENSKIRIASGEVSREHCLLIARDEGVLVRELGSRNGTFLNGKPIDGEQLLPPGGTLTIGPMTFQLAGDSANAASVAAARKAALRRHPQVEQALSDDDIASLLAADDKAPEASLLHDTTVIPMNQPDEGTAEITPPPPAPAIKRREFKSIAEEAADIIRRHYEAVGQARAAR